MTSVSSSLFGRIAWTLALPLVALTALIQAAPEHRLYMALLSSACYAAVPSLLPKCRFETNRYLCPLNLALGLFFFKLVLIPVLMMVDHPSPGVLAEVPRRLAIEWAMVVELVAFLAFCLGIQFVPERIAAPSLLKHLDRHPSFVVLGIFIAAGAVGMSAFFGNIPALVEYFINPSSVANLKQNAEGNLAWAVRDRPAAVPSVCPDPGLDDICRSARCKGAHLANDRSYLGARHPDHLHQPDV